MLAEPPGTAPPVHIEHADEEGAGFLRLDYVVGGKNARHVPNFEILLDVA